MFESDYLWLLFTYLNLFGTVRLVDYVHFFQLICLSIHGEYWRASFSLTCPTFPGTNIQVSGSLPIVMKTWALSKK